MRLSPEKGLEKSDDRRNLQLERKISSAESLPRIYSRFEKDITFRDATDEEIENILEKVADGHMFTTDKVALVNL